MLHLLIFVSAFYYGIADIINIPETFSELCPYTNVCNLSARQVLTTPGMQPCCRSCACDSNCGLRFDCCFKELDTYNLVDRGIAACIEPISGNRNALEKLNSFYMIQSCLDGENKSKRHCEIEDEYENSLIAPVSSTKTGQIYINAECARCNGLLDFTEWKAMLFSQGNFKKNSVNWCVEESLINNASAIVYVPPADEDWQRLKCYREFISKCTYGEYYELCNSLYAPYTSFTRITYTSVFCRKCEGDKSQIVFECVPDDPIKGILDTSMIVLLTRDEIINLMQSNKNELFSSVIGQECADENEANTQIKCLRLYCPEGQIQTAKGCTYFGLWWYRSFYVMQIKLLPNSDQHLFYSDLLYMKYKERNNPFSWISPPCKQAMLSDMRVFYDNSGNKTEGEIVKSFIVIVGKNTKISNGFDPSVVIPAMQQCVDNSWLFTINGTSYKLKASFDDYIGYVQDGRQLLMQSFSKSGHPIYQEKPYPAIYEALSTVVTADFKLADVFLRKSYFCKQVRIPIDQVEASYGKITILSKNITLGNNKYTTNYYREAGKVNYNKTTVSVCLEDYTPSNASRSVLIRTVDGVVVYLCLILKLAFSLF